jgi:zinc protease
MRREILAFALVACIAVAQEPPPLPPITISRMPAARENGDMIRRVTLPDTSSVVHFRFVFAAGSAANPPDKPGVANLTAAMLSRGGTRSLTYRQVVDSLFPMASGISAVVDQEMTTFTGSTHVDNLEAYYRLFRSMLLEPGWRADDFARLKDEAINALTVELKGNNDEELGKEVLYSTIYKGTRYEHPNLGTVSSLRAITLDDLRRYYQRNYTRRNLILGIAGGYKPSFLERVQKDFAKLPPLDPGLPLQGWPAVTPAPVEHTRAVLVEKNTRSVAYSFGFPIDVKRGDPDFPALLLMQTYLGQHRSGGRLYDRIREVRGINYGDYAYIEYFPRGMFRMEPEQNLARQSQIFQIWIRPAEPPAAAFTLRLAHYELAKLIRDGIPQEGFDRAKENLGKFVDVLTRTKQAQLGYAIDSLFYNIIDYNTYIKRGVASLTRDQVNAAIRKHLRTDRMQIVAITEGAEALGKKLVGTGPTPIEYNSPKPKDILDEDKIVERWDIGLRPEDLTVVPVDRVFE